MGTRELLVRIDETTDPLENLAKEESIFRQVEQGSLPEVLRFWRNTECLVRGGVKSPRYGWYDEELAAKMGVPVFERSTGGGVVYQDLGNLNWSFFLRTSGAFLSPTVAFNQASKCLVGTLGGLGVPAYFSPPNRIDVSSRKVSGMAARSTVRTLLVHGTLLLNSDLDKLNLLCLPPAASPPVSNLSEWVAGINASSVIEAIVDALETSGFQANFVDGMT